jgi:hypothetical protein
MAGKALLAKTLSGKDAAKPKVRVCRNFDWRSETSFATAEYNVLSKCETPFGLFLRPYCC